MVLVSGRETMTENPICIIKIIRIQGLIKIEYWAVGSVGQLSYMVPSPEHRPVRPWCLTGMRKPCAEVRVPDNQW